MYRHKSNGSGKCIYKKNKQKYPFSARDMVVLHVNVKYLGIVSKTLKKE
jgi:hypothetical protein